MKKLFKEFAAFINKGNALAMAIGVIIGGSFTKIVTAINAKIISPLIGAVMGSSDLSGSMITVLAYQKDEAGNIVLDATTGQPVIANAIYWAERINQEIEERRQAEEAAAAAAEPVVEEVAPVVEEVKEPEDVTLLKEIRDLLASKVVNE